MQKKDNQILIPNHIAIIPNGNRTWARLKGVRESEGHKAGVEKLAELARHMRHRGVHTATVWGLSTENILKRKPEEIKWLIKLLEYTLNKWAKEAHQDGAKLIHLGRKEHMPKQILELVTFWEEKTKANAKHVINVAFDYGGHDEILRAMKKAFTDIQNKKITFEDLYKEDGFYHEKYPYLYFKNYLDTKDQPYPFPDLIIRAAGEYRLSGFMPWQSVYSEFYTTDELLPDFTVETIDKAIETYSKRNRKFGGN